MSDSDETFDAERRQFLGFAATSAFGALLPDLAWAQTVDAPLAATPARSFGLPPVADDALLADLERRSFDYFWETADPATGLVPDRWPTPSFASVAAVGFALSAYPIAVDRGWITRAQAVERTLATLRFFASAPQGPAASGMAGHKGFFYHFLDMQTGVRYGNTELSSVDTALLLAGALHCQSYFDVEAGPEATIRSLVDEIYSQVDWPWLQVRGAAISHGWRPERGHIRYDWTGYNEAMIVYLLALGSPTHPVGADAWDAWTSTYDRDWGADEFGLARLRFASLFGHQFSHIWVDFRGLQDAYLRAKGIDYFENSRRATYAQQSYAIVNPEGWTAYGENVWGITACDGPADVRRRYDGDVRRFASYAGRGMGGLSRYDDGTIAPYGAGCSLPFAPAIVQRALAEMRERWGAEILGRYGFYAFNPSFTYTDVTLKHGRVVPELGWVNTDFVGIEVGPLLAMIANHRANLVWNTMRRNAHLRRGLQRAGFSGGWLA